MPETSVAARTLKVLVVDDHPAVREALCMRIAQQPDLTVCGEAADAGEALRLCNATAPDIIITDITLKNSDGIDLIKRVKTHNAAARILVWSMHGENLYAERALRAGAMGYITKEQATGQIIDAIRQVLNGQVYLSPQMREKVLRRTMGNHQPQPHSSVDALTDRELEVFRLIGAGVKTHDIADRLHLSIKTVETHRARIKRKLDIADANELIRTAVLWVTEHERTPAP